MTEPVEPATPRAASEPLVTHTRPRTRRLLAPWLLLVGPVVLLQLAAVGSLIAGRDTLFLRDVLATHLAMKEAEAAALRAGSLPVLDVQRGGGQPLLGNPNGAPLYPTNVLYVAASSIWSLNAHFWLHFLLAPWCFAWLARRLGCGREAAWAGGAVYATSGFFLSQMSFYDLVPGAALAPAFVAACLAARDGSSARMAAAAGGLWTLLLLGGDPAFAAVAFGGALLALLFVRGADDGFSHREGAERPWRSRWSRLLRRFAPRNDGAELSSPAIHAGVEHSRWLPLLLFGIVAGTAVAAPQIVELLRALPTSTRGVRGYDAVASTIGSWDPRQLVEQLLPLPFGRIDRGGPGGFWGHRFHTGNLPFLVTLYPGLLPLALALAAGRARGRGGAFAWSALGLGLFVALGRFNPLLDWLASLAGESVVRFPVKAWLLVAIGLAALAAIGWERALALGEPAAARRLRGALIALGAALLLAAAAAAAFSSALHAWMVGQLARSTPRQLVNGEPARWAITCAALGALALVLAWLASRHAPMRFVAPAMLALHVGAQLVLLVPATMPRDRAAPYSRPPEFASLLPAGTRVAHGSMSRLFGSARGRALPRGEGRWLVRQGATSGFPLVGVPLGWRYELARSPEGLDGVLTRLAAESLRGLDDARRLRLLRVWGIEALLLERPLAAGVTGVPLVARASGPLAPIFVHRIEGTVPEVRRVAGARVAKHPGAAIAILLDPRFDPRAEVVLPEPGSPAPPGAGRATLERATTESFRIASDDTRPGWVVVQRAWQPHWRATVDGRATPVLAADLHRMAVAVPAGSHLVELWVDRTPLHRAALAATAGLLALLLLASPWRRRSHLLPLPPS